MLELSKYTAAVITAFLLAGAQFSARAENVRATGYSLEQLIEKALQNNPDLQIMRERITQAEAQWGEALSGFYPEIKTRLSYEHTDDPSRAFGMIISQRRLDFNDTDFNHPGGTDNYRPEVVTRYSLFNGGQDYQNTKAAELGVKAASLQASATRNQLIESVASLFYAVLAAKEAHNIAERSISAVESELKQSRIRFDAGTALKSDILSLEVQLAEAQDNEIQTANAVELSLNGLKTLLGAGADESITISEVHSWKLPELRQPFPELLAQALSRRPETKAAKAQVEIAERRLKAAQGEYLPKADAYVLYGSDSKNLDFSGSRDNVTAGVTVSVDVFSGFASSERIKKAERELSIAKLAAKRMQLSIEEEVKTAFLKLKNALNRLKVTAASVLSAEEALRLIKERRTAGIETVTRYIEAEVALDKAQSRDIAARFDALRAEAELNKALGVWK
ncbi:MAG: TolC family protein [Gammaproteobacteria bacterium]